MKERERFLRRLNRFISTAQAKSPGEGQLAQLKALDVMVSTAITEAQQARKGRRPATKKGVALAGGMEH